jgi:hypothetical protein
MSGDFDTATLHCVRRGACFAKIPTFVRPHPFGWIKTHLL